MDHPGLLLLVHPRPLIVAAAVKDFVPNEGARRTFREVSAIYRRFGAAGRAALVEGFGPFTPQPAEALRCTAPGQVRADLQGRSLMDVIRDHYRAGRPFIR